MNGVSSFVYVLLFAISEDQEGDQEQLNDRGVSPAMNQLPSRDVWDSIMRRIRDTPRQN